MVLMLANLKWLKYLDNKCVFFFVTCLPSYFLTSPSTTDTWNRKSIPVNGKFKACFTKDKNHSECSRGKGLPLFSSHLWPFEIKHSYKEIMIHYVMVVLVFTIFVLMQNLAWKGFLLFTIFDMFIVQKKICIQSFVENLIVINWHCFKRLLNAGR